MTASFAAEARHGGAVAKRGRQPHAVPPATARAHVAPSHGERRTSILGLPNGARATLAPAGYRRTWKRTFRLVDKASGRVAGFYGLSSHSIPLDEAAADVAKKLPRYASIPAVLIGWLGRDVHFRGQHVGSTLVADAITRLAAAPIGVHAICADAIDQTAAAFYREHQFQPFASRPNTFYLPMRTARALV